MDFDDFAGTTAIVAGAEYPAARLFAQSLAQHAARVVVIGRQDEQLMQIARAAPDRIETLAMTPGRGAMLANLQEAWGDTPIHLYADFMPLGIAVAQHLPGEAIARSAGLAASLLRGLKAGSARGLVVLRDADLVPQKPGELFAAWIRQMSRDMTPGHMQGLSVPAGTMVHTPDMVHQLSQSCARLLHPSAGQIGAGEVMSLSAQKGAWPGPARGTHGNQKE